MELVWSLLGICCLLGLVAIVLVAPGRMSPETKKTAKPFCGLSCAHRGLYTQDQSIPENSLSAFQAAREAGYGVELDVQLSRDGQVVVFHDDDLRRVCGVEAGVNELDYAGLKELSLSGTKERIPLLLEALKVLKDTPVIVELKTAGKQNSELCQKVLTILREQGKTWCVESFDPRIVLWFRKNAPDVLRGQLSNPPKDFDNLSAPLAFALGNLLTNVAARPHFIAYRAKPLPLCVRLCLCMKPMTVVWTVGADEEHESFHQKNDTVIFEHYRPTPRQALKDRRHD